MTILLYAMTAILYAGLAVASWQGYRRDAALVIDGAGGARMPAGAGSNALHWPLQGVLLVALVVHGVLLHQTIFRADSMYFGFAYALSAMLWLSVGIYWIESFFFPLDSLRILVMPTASLACLMPLLFADNRILSFAANPVFKLHFIIANMAYGLFALAALHAMLMLYAERQLHPARAGERSGGWLTRWLDTLPPLLTLEKLLFRLIGAGFVLLTLTLVSGVMFSETLFGRAVRIDHKTVFAVISWVMFGAVLVGRQLYGWRGKVALRWVLASFVTLLLAYVGSRFVLEVVLHRMTER
ncbi:ABC transporter permease [Pandoraea terrae]|uniref:ABC transporter permease n=1 Tax=Pandoraea terrae TaxID=1537710 RepID=A0A5E4YQZ2_9BURK|nr:cytochrome c biogenesis protein CcsA [Pandoraea terrae]VVE51249.1 ABC transporter permease [Pandoraea terrae]